jgi:hypothetical protein
MSTIKELQAKTHELEDLRNELVKKLEDYRSMLDGLSESNGDYLIPKPIVALLDMEIRDLIQKARHA